MVIMGGAGTLPAGKEKRISGSISAWAIGSIRSSILIRLCAWRALLAL